MELNNPVIRLCMQGIQAEFQGGKGKACEFYRQAWEAATEHYEACIAAHYLARCQDSPEETLRWNRIALERAEAADTVRVRDFYPSLYLNLGRSYEVLGDQAEAAKYYALAAQLGFRHQME